MATFRRHAPIVRGHPSVPHGPSQDPGRCRRDLLRPLPPPRFAEALTGAAGDALLAAHDATVNTWSDHQDKHAAAATAASQALVHITGGLQTRIDNLAEAGGEEEFNTAIRNRDPLAAMEVWTRYNGHAEESTSEATKKATSAIQAANFTIPPRHPPESSRRREPLGKQ